MGVKQYNPTTGDSRYYELAYYEVPVNTSFLLPHACFNALKYGLYEHGSSENTGITRTIQKPTKEIPVQTVKLFVAFKTHNRGVKWTLQIATLIRNRESQVGKQGC